MITIFIGTFNRLDTLARTVASYSRFKTPHELVIVDNGTDHPESLKLLKALESEVKKVYHLPGCDSMEEVTNNFNIAIRDQHEGDGGEWFAVTEADVCFEDTDVRALDAYIAVAKAEKTAVGPHLRVDRGIPAHYPLRSRVLACESRLLYKYNMKWFEGIPYTKCQTDTTFHLFPRTRFFNRLHLNPIRVGPPYDAKHLDWYLDIFDPSPENYIYIQGMRPVGSWGKAWIRDFWRWFQDDQEFAFQKLMNEPLNEHDLCNVSFMRSWCFQYGYGTEVDLDASKSWLYRAIPYPHEYYWPFEENWMAMIYANDFSSLGWE